MSWRKIKRFYRPNIITASLAFLCLGLTLKFIVPLFSFIKIIPCTIFTEGVPRMGLCPINPDPAASRLDSFYFFFNIGDWIYQAFYFILIVGVIPYTLSCFFFHAYYKYIKKMFRRV